MAVVITLIVVSVLLVVGAVGSANRIKHRLHDASPVNHDGPATAAQPRIARIARNARHARVSPHVTQPAKELS